MGKKRKSLRRESWQLFLYCSDLRLPQALSSMIVRAMSFMYIAGVFFVLDVIL